MAAGRHTNATDDTVANIPTAPGVTPRSNGFSVQDASTVEHASLLGAQPFGDEIDDGSTDHVDLGTDPFDDDLAAQLTSRKPFRWTSRTTLSLAGAVLLVGGFVGGILVQKNFGDQSNPRNPTGLAASARPGLGGFTGRGGGTGGTGGGAGGTAGGGTGGSGTGGGGTGAARDATTGKVTMVDGTTVYLTTADGQVVTVKTSSSTAVSIAQAGTLKDIPAGSTVTVQGTADADGIITATQVTGQK